MVILRMTLTHARRQLAARGERVRTRGAHHPASRRRCASYPARQQPRAALRTMRTRSHNPRIPLLSCTAACIDPRPTLKHQPRTHNPSTQTLGSNPWTQTHLVGTIYPGHKHHGPLTQHHRPWTQNTIKPGVRRYLVEIKEIVKERPDIQQHPPHAGVPQFLQTRTASAPPFPACAVKGIM